MIICKIHPAFTIRNTGDKLHQSLQLSIGSKELLSWRPGPWRAMFVTQPPITFDLLYAVNGPADSIRTQKDAARFGETAVTLGGEGAVTLGAVQDVVRKSLGGRALPDTKYVFPTRIVFDKESRDRFFIHEESGWVKFAREHPERRLSEYFFGLRVNWQAVA